MSLASVSARIARQHRAFANSLSVALSAVQACSLALLIIAFLAPAKANALDPWVPGYWQGAYGNATAHFDNPQSVCETYQPIYGKMETFGPSTSADGDVKAVCWGPNPYPHDWAIYMFCPPGGYTMSSGGCFLRYQPPEPPCPCNAPKDPRTGRGQGNRRVGNPVYVQTGDKVAGELDFESSGPNPLQFLRKYSLHSGGYQNSFGGRWSSILDRKVVFQSDGDAKVTLDGGYYIDFSKSGSVYSAKIQGTEGVLSQIDSNTWEFRDPYGEISTFAKSGTTSARLTSVRYANGYVMTMSGAPRVTSISDSFGRALNFTWDGDHVVAVTAPGGVTLTYGYETVVLPGATGGTVTTVAGSYPGVRLVSVTKTVSGTSGSQARQYHYEDPFTLYALTGITDERGIRVSTYQYSFQRVVDEQGPSGANHLTYSYDLLNNFTTVTDSLGKARIFNYSLVSGRMLLTDIAEQAATNSPAATSTLSYGTDKRLSTSLDQEGRTTSYSRSTLGQETSRTEAVGTGQARTRTIAWHASTPSPTEVIEPGRTTTFTYQAASVSNGSGGGGVPACSSGASPCAVGLTNPGAEAGDATGWTAISPMSTIPTSVTSGGNNAPFSGTRLFVAAANAAATWWGQTVTLPSEILNDVDAGILQAEFSGYQVGFSTDADSGGLVVEMLDGSGTWLSGHYPGLTDLTAWTQKSVTREIPPGTRQIRVSVRGYRSSGTELSQYFDDFALKITESGSKYDLLYSLPAANVTGWTQVSGTLTILTAAQDPFGADTGFMFTGATGEAYTEIAISDPLQVADIDNGLAEIVFHARYAKYPPQTDKGRTYVKFYNASNVQVGTTLYSDATEVVASPSTGQDKTLTGSVPANTRKVRIGFTGTRVEAGANLDTYWSRMSVLLKR